MKYVYRVDGGDYSNMLKRNKLSRMPEARQRQVASLLKSSARQAVYERKYRITLQFDLNGNFIKKYESIVLAAKDMNVSKSTIRGVLINSRKTSAGFIWKYLD